MSLRVASYNIRKAIGTDRRRDPNRIIDVLSEIDADIIALQEADRRFGRRLAVLPDRLLDAHSDYWAVPLDVQTDSMGWHGNAVLIRREAALLSHDIIHLPYLEPRGAVTAVVATGGITVRLYAMHLDLSGLWRRRQASAVLHHSDGANATDPLPTVLMGDLNEWSANGGCLRDFARAHSNAPCGRSFHARQPIAQLDRIFHCGRLRLIDCGVHHSLLARRASDHLPVWADVEMA